MIDETLIGAEPSAGTDPGPWSDALLAATLIAVDPQGLGGVHVRARAGPVRDKWLAYLETQFASDLPRRRISAGIAEARLTGGLDIGATLSLGRPTVEQGVLAAADGGMVVLAMAERLSASASGVIGMALDEGHVRIERDGVSARQPARFALIALDEGVDDDEAVSPSLSDRLGLRVDLSTVGWREAIHAAAEPDLQAARRTLSQVEVPEALAEALCAVALNAAPGSMRPTLHLMQTTRAAAALRGAIVADLADAILALRLVLGLRVSEPPVEHPDDQVNEAEPPPDPEEAPSPRDATPEKPEDQEALSAQALQDMLVEAVQATLPKHLLRSQDSAAARNAPGSAGKAGAVRNRGTRGRAIGIAASPPVPAARLDVLATLRQAAPWQRLRAGAALSHGVADATPRLHIRKDDFRYVRYRDKTGTTAIFAVDASGSAAVERLAETKGAVELLLAECYVRRDSVALIAFRGKGAETLLEPTRSLVRAKRSLSALPGGGGTPLASGIMASLGLARASILKGQSVVAVFLTDGRGNIALDGSIARETVAADTQRAAQLFRASCIRSILIDTAQRPQARAEALARELGAEYLALPRGGARRLSREIGARMEGRHDGPHA